MFVDLFLCVCVSVTSYTQLGSRAGGNAQTQSGYNQSWPQWQGGDGQPQAPAPSAAPPSQTASVQPGASGPQPAGPVGSGPSTAQGSSQEEQFSEVFQMLNNANEFGEISGMFNTFTD